ncbi:hypothetical protein ACN47E_001065 [Coniothyrium glycines]
MAATPRQSVCIVGGGPAGLVAAKTFLQHGGFSVSVFEAANRVGGMWRARPDEHGVKCNPDMKTNLSRFTVAFSDLSWSSVDLSLPKAGSSTAAIPMFPKAWQVGRYLEAYARKFDLLSSVKLNTRVIRARLTDDEKPWEVVAEDIVTGQEICGTFHFLIIASGFFDRPARSFDPSFGKTSPNVQHSSSFRNVASLSKQPGKIVVIGGGISGSEAAAQAAFQISNAKHSPHNLQPVHADSKIYHIINRPFYCLPRHLPVNPYKSGTSTFNPAPAFLPLDLVLYNLSRRGDEEISAAIATVPPEKARKGHEFIRSVIGGAQQDYGQPALFYEPNQLQNPAYSGITDTYMEFVRSGLIMPVHGWVDEVKVQQDAEQFDITLKTYEPWFYDPRKEPKSVDTIRDIVGIIEATGYKTNIEFLDGDIRELLCHDPSCARIPILLTRGSIFAEEIPTIGFVGFYEGPYWGVMEMQARIIADAWSTHLAAQRHLRAPDFGSNEYRLCSHQVTERMRHALKYARSLQVPQFWMSDYVGLMEELAREADVQRDDEAFGRQAGPLIPSRYQGEGTDPEAMMVVKELIEVLKASNEQARFVAAAVFRGMQGIWMLKRKIDSRNASAPGGVFEGTAQFHPRAPTAPAYSAEYLYIEQGRFTMETGYSFPAKRHYVYRYNESSDKITAWFTHEDGVSVGALFNTWDFYAQDDEDHGWMARGHHWCDPDTYCNTCEFRFEGASIQTFGITYNVEGPKKDYSHETWYKRPQVTHS